MKTFLSILFCFLFSATLFAEDGSRLWLRYASPATLGFRFGQVAADESSPVIRIALKELDTAWKSFTGEAITHTSSRANATLVIGTGKSKVVTSLLPPKSLEGLGRDGFLIKTVGSQLVIASPSDKGVLYGVFHFLRLVATEQWNGNEIRETPAYERRILN
ncbi:MAG: hypothetical protein LBB84_12290, partial [Tannerellaceae bacterium]|nr:hypothetical protein [Tannerellaceae bacterium]